MTVSDRRAVPGPRGRFTKAWHFLRPGLPLFALRHLWWCVETDTRGKSRLLEAVGEPGVLTLSCPSQSSRESLGLQPGRWPKAAPQAACSQAVSWLRVEGAPRAHAAPQQALLEGTPLNTRPDSGSCHRTTPARLLGSQFTEHLKPQMQNLSD